MRLPQGSHKWIDQLKAFPDKKTLRVAIQAACGANEGSFGRVFTGAFTRRQEGGNFKYKSFLNERVKHAIIVITRIAGDAESFYPRTRGSPQAHHNCSSPPITPPGEVCVS